MGTMEWVIIIALLVVLIGIAVVIWRGYGVAVFHALQIVGTRLWASAVGRHAIVVILLLLLLTGAEEYTRRVAEEKAGEWLTSYNGTETTEVVGKIKVSLPGFLSIS